MKRFFKFAGVFLRSFPQLLLFELLFKLILTALGAPLLAFLLRIAMKYSGIGYLSSENIAGFLLSPATIIVMALTLFIIAFFSIVELSALIACFACRHEHRKITVIGMLKAGLSAFVKAFKGAGILNFLGFMLIIPLAQFTLSSGIFFAPIMPMIRLLFSSAGKLTYIAAFILIQLGITFLLSSRSYSLHFLVLTKHPFPQCTKKSRSCLEGRRLKTTLFLLLWSILLLVAVSAVTFALSFVIIFCIKGFSAPEAALTSALKVLRYTGQIFYAVSAVISAPIIISCLTSKFFSDTQYTEKLMLPVDAEKKAPKLAKAVIMVCITAICVFLNFSYLEGLYKGNIRLNIGIFSNPQITAHRGFSYAAPENTGYAFEEAIRIGSDYIELDVQQTADGQLVVFHDSKLDRTTDGTGYLSDYTYDELSQLSCGSWFKKGDFSDARIMLLSEVLELTGDDILLNIEIKNLGDTDDTARKTAELLIAYDMTDSCYVTSFSYQALKTVKKIEPDIKTGLISNAAASAVYSQLKYIDAVSLNYIFVNQNIINSAHKSGKKVFVWTVNSREDMEHMISLGADNIITDRPDIAAEVIYSYGKGDFVISLLERIFGT